MIQEVRLHFCTLRLLAPDIVEAIVDEGVEISAAQIKEAHAAFDRLTGGRPCGNLVSKLNSYTYSFAAQKEIYNQPTVRALAYHAPDASRRMALASLLEVAKSEIRFPIQIFDHREDALRWLRQQLDGAAAQSQRA